MAHTENTQTETITERDIEIAEPEFVGYAWHEIVEVIEEHEAEAAWARCKARFSEYN